MPDARGKAKREPALTDTDVMPFGKYRDKPMQDVPASYLWWLYEQGLENISDQKVANYIWNSLDAIKMEMKERERDE